MSKSKDTSPGRLLLKCASSPEKFITTKSFWLSASRKKAKTAFPPSLYYVKIYIIKRRLNASGALSRRRGCTGLISVQSIHWHISTACSGTISVPTISPCIPVSAAGLSTVIKRQKTPYIRCVQGSGWMSASSTALSGRSGRIQQCRSIPSAMMYPCSSFPKRSRSAMSQVIRTQPIRFPCTVWFQNNHIK